MTKRVRRCVLGLTATVCFAGAVLFFVWPESKFQTLPLANGTQIRFLGATHTGTNHWNPTISPMQRAALQVIGRLPDGWATALSSRMLKRAENSPAMAVVPVQSSVALWFWSDSAETGDHIVIRCLGASGEELSAGYNVPFSSPLRAAVVWLMQVSDEVARRVRHVEVWRRNSPLRHDGNSVAQSPFFHALNPISELELDPGHRVGRFEVVRRDR